MKLIGEGRKMGGKYVASVLSLLLLASVLAVGFTIHSVSGATATLSIPSVAKNPSDNGTLFTVPVNVSSVSDLFGFDINITWGNTLITLSSLNNASLNTIWPQGFFDAFYQTGPGYVDYAAVATGGSGYTNLTGSGTLFTLTFAIINTGNFPLSTTIQFYAVKLSDSQANIITPILNNGSYSMGATTPGISFNLVNPNAAKPWEYGKYFEVQVNATNIISHLNSYNITIIYPSEFINFSCGGVADMPYSSPWGVLGTGSFDNTTSGSVHVWMSTPSGTPYVGNNGLLFTLDFRVGFDTRSSHIWSNATAPNQLNFTISLNTTTGNLSFQEGTIAIGGVTAPAPITVTINLIQGDVDVNGQVNILDLRDVAYYYDQTVPPAPAIYDLKKDNIIDIYDMVEVAKNFGYNKTDTHP